jgi:apolipoprotein N-acyltransferase
MRIDQTMTPVDRAEESSKPADYRTWAGVASGLLLWSTFPPVEWHWLAWLSLAPLFWLSIQSGSRWRIYLPAWAGGLAFWLPSVQWIRLTDPSAIGAWLAMALIFSAWWPGFVLIVRIAVFRMRLPLILAAPIIWVGLEYSRAFILTGFPWYHLAHSQYRNLHLIQIADLTGSLGLSLLIALVNALIVDLLTLPLLRRTATGTRVTRRQMMRLWTISLLICATLTYGSARINSAQFHDGPRLGLLQSNIPQHLKSGGDWEKILEEFRHLIEVAMRRPEPPDLLVWPETSYPYGYVSIDPAVTSSRLQDQLRDSIHSDMTPKEWTEYGKAHADRLHAWTDSVRVPMLVGCLFYDHRPDGLRKYNSAILFEPMVQAVRFYHKIHLVPFGEYIPFLETLPWLQVFTPYRNGHVPTLTFGEEYRRIDLNGSRLAVAICFEDTVPDLVRRFFENTAADDQPDVLVNISNDGWFHGSSELDMHLAVSVFRTVENRVPLARSVNTGISALIDGNGQIRQSLPKGESGVLSVKVPLDDRTSFYSKRGDWLGLSCLSVSIGLLVLGPIGRRPLRPRSPTGSADS